MQLNDILFKMIQTMNQPTFPKSELASLQRLSITDVSLGFYRFVASYDVVFHSEEDEKKWSIAVYAIAVLHTLHQSKSLGSCLAECDVSDIRFAKLLSSREDTLFDEIESFIRFCRNKDTAINIIELIQLVFITDTTKAESLRRKLARDFYATQYKNKNNK